MPLNLLLVPLCVCHFIYHTILWHLSSDITLFPGVSPSTHHQPKLTTEIISRRPICVLFWNNFVSLSLAFAPIAFSPWLRRLKHLWKYCNYLFCGNIRCNRIDPFAQNAAIAPTWNKSSALSWPHIKFWLLLPWMRLFFKKIMSNHVIIKLNFTSWRARNHLLLRCNRMLWS